jgi:glycosyltransferase involved in cell wall biosynthesis
MFDNSEMGKGIVHKVKAGINSIYNTSSAKKVENAIENFKPDIVHVHNFYFTASPAVIIEANRHAVPVVLTVHNYRLICANCLLLRDNKVCELCVPHDFPWYGVKYKCYHDSAVQSAMVGAIAAIHKWMGTWKNKVDLFITPAKFSRLKLINSSLKVSPEKIKVKRNFVEDPGAGAAEKRKSNYLFVGRLSAEKGIDVLLKAWTGLPGEQLIIAGDGPDRDKLVSEYGYLSNVTFTGKMPREEVLELMKDCRALIFPSIWYEGLPMTIIEAFATGTPVIASSLGAMEEMIEHGKNGFLFESGNALQLAAAIQHFNELTATRDYSMYENARKSYLDQYHPEKCYDAIMAMYHHLIHSTIPRSNTDG